MFIILFLGYEIRFMEWVSELVPWKKFDAADLFMYLVFCDFRTIFTACIAWITVTLYDECLCFWHFGPVCSRFISIWLEKVWRSPFVLYWLNESLIIGGVQLTYCSTLSLINEYFLLQHSLWKDPSAKLCEQFCFSSSSIVINKFYFKTSSADLHHRAVYISPK